MSGAYIGSELQSEFGRLPPSFLPLANRRLFVKQADSRCDSEDVYLTIPNSYELESHDINSLRINNINVIRVSDTASIGESLSQALILAKPKIGEKLSVLFGDTLIDSFPQEYNSIGITQVRDDYGWAKLGDILNEDIEQYSDVKNHVFSGHFSIGSPDNFLKLLAMNNFCLFSSLNNLHKLEGFYIDDNQSWLDFGHVNTYYSSRAKYTTQRSFNHLSITTEKVRKSSDQTSKMIGESNWFNQIPASLKIFTPQFLGDFSSPHRGYELEYLYNTPINELFVFSKLTNKTWKKIISSCFNFLEKCSGYSDDTFNFELDDLFENKTKLRLSEYLSKSEGSLDTLWDFNGNPPVSILDIIHDISDSVPSKSRTCIMHGDYCFSNIIYDFKTDRIKVIDPRGVDLSGNPTIYGSQYYDVAKLAHSLSGLYDEILAGAFRLKFETGRIRFQIIETNEHNELEQWFYSQCLIRFELSKKQIIAMQIHLFLSMLPLHSDDLIRQQALFSNVFRLYYKFLEEK